MLRQRASRRALPLCFGWQPAADEGAVRARVAPANARHGLVCGARHERRVSVGVSPRIAVCARVTDAAIDVLRQEYAGLEIKTTADYERVRLAIADVRDRRVTVEKTRVELKAGALEYGRRVDSEAKRITAMLAEIEEPLKAEKQRVDDEKARVKREKEEAERARIEAELKAKREAEEAEAVAESFLDIAETGRRLNHLSAEVAMLEERWLELQTEIEAMTAQAG